MKKVMPYIDVIIGNEEDFEKMLGIKAEGGTESYSDLDPENYKTVARQVVKAISQCTGGWNNFATCEDCSSE